MNRRGQDGHTSQVQVAIYIRVIVWHADQHRRIFQRRRHIVVRNRWVVHWRNIQVHDCHIAVSVSVADLVGELIRAVVVRIRRIVDGIVGWVVRCAAIIHYCCAMSWRVKDENRADGGAITTKVIVDQYSKIGSRCVFYKREHPIVHGIWQVIDGRYSDVHRSRVAVYWNSCIADLVSEYIRAVIVWIRGVGHTASCRINAEGTMGW